MRALVYYVAASIDGRIADPHGGFDAFPTEGDHLEMVVRDWADTIPKVGLDALGLVADNSRFGAVVMGWNTYAAGLPVTDDPYPHLDQYVFSRTRTADDVPGGITLAESDPVSVVRELKAQDGADIWLCGGGQLAAQLAGEIDRLVIKVNPLIFGAGRSLFDESGGYEPRSFALTASTGYASGVVVNEYERKVSA